MKWSLPALLLFVSCDDPKSVHTAPTGTLHRLNAAEYDNTVRSLLGTSQRPATRFPSDGALHGFNNVAEALTVSPMMVDLHEMAIDDLLDELFEGPELQSTERPTDAEAPQHTQPHGGIVNLGNGYRVIHVGEGVAVTYVDVPYDGAYTWVIDTIEVHPDGVEVSVAVDGFVIAETTITEPGPHSVDLKLEAGYRVIDLTVIAESTSPGLFIDTLSLDGPFSATGDASQHYNDVLFCDPDKDRAHCARNIIGDFGAKAWRRPLTDGEIEDFARIYAEAASLGMDWEHSIKWALKAVLFSPEFLFRVEDLERPLGPPLLEDHAIAARLSYFLWSTSPDAQLTAAANAGQLADPQVIAAQVRRMLADPRAVALVDNFASQWWGTDQLLFSLPETAQWDDPLRVAMIAELDFLAAEFLLEGRSMKELLLFEETHGNQRLAAHYRLDHSGGGDWETLNLAGSGRRGLFTTAGFLTINTTEVLRGKAVMEQLMCDFFPPPPPGAAELGLQNIEAGEGSMRERVENTRTYNPECTGCHAILDPIGFSLGTFDIAGAERTQDIYGFEIDTSGMTPDGQPVANAAELSTALAEDPDFAACIVEKSLIYALGRKPARGEDAIVEQITTEFVSGGYRFEDLAIAIATSDAFRSNALR